MPSVQRGCVEAGRQPCHRPLAGRLPRADGCPMIAADLRAGLDPMVVFERAFGVTAHKWQNSYLRESRNAIVLKGRQIGASSAAAALAIHQARYHPDTNAI